MRKFLIWLVVLAIVAALGCLAAEQLIVRELRRIDAEGTAFQTSRIEPLEGPSRMGARLVAPVAVLPEGRLALERADLWIEPLSPLTARIGLPGRALVDLPDGQHELRFAAPELSARFRALAGFSPGTLRFSARDLVLDGTPLARSVAVAGDAVPVAEDAPPASQAGYDVDWSLDDLDPQALPSLARLTRLLKPEDRLAFSGKGRVWLDKVPTTRAMAAIPTPALTGLRLDQGELRLGAVRARVVGRLDADAQGRASGAVAIYTRDAGPMLAAAAEAGIIPQAAETLAEAMIRRISAMPATGGGNHGADFPEAAGDELRLPLTFADGRMRLGPIPLGPAPRLRP